MSPMRRVSSCATTPATSATPTERAETKSTRGPMFACCLSALAEASAGPIDGARGSTSVVEELVASCSDMAGPSRRFLFEEHRRRRGAAHFAQERLQRPREGAARGTRQAAERLQEMDLDCLG